MDLYYKGFDLGSEADIKRAIKYSLAMMKFTEGVRGRNKKTPVKELFYLAVYCSEFYY